MGRGHPALPRRNDCGIGGGGGVSPTFSGTEFLFSFLFLHDFLKEQNRAGPV